MAIYGMIAGFLIASVTAVGIGAGLDSPRSLMTRQDYSEGRKALEARARLALGECRTREGLDRARCRLAVRSEERVQRAQLEARYRGTVDAESAVLVAQKKAARAVADPRPSPI